MWTLYSMRQVLGQIILLIYFNITYIGATILKYICVAIDLGFRISWFWYKYKKQMRFRIILLAYWMIIFISKVLYGRTPDIRG